MKEWKETLGHSKKSVLDTIEFVLERRAPGERWGQPAELGTISENWDNFDHEAQNIILVAIPEVAPYLLKRKIQKLR